MQGLGWPGRINPKTIVRALLRTFQEGIQNLWRRSALEQRIRTRAVWGSSGIVIVAFVMTLTFLYRDLSAMNPGYAFKSLPLIAKPSGCALEPIASNTSPLAVPRRLATVGSLSANRYSTHFPSQSKFPAGDTSPPNYNV